MSVKTRLASLGHKLPRVAGLSGAADKLSANKVKKAVERKILTPAQGAVLQHVVSLTADRSIAGVQQGLNSFGAVYRAANPTGEGVVSREQIVTAQENYDLWRVATEAAPAEAADFAGAVIKRKVGDGSKQPVHGVGSMLGKLEALKNDPKITPRFKELLAAAARARAAQNSDVRETLTGPGGQQAQVSVSVARYGDHSMTFSLADKNQVPNGPQVSLRFVDKELKSVRVNPEGVRFGTFPEYNAALIDGQLTILSAQADGYVAAPAVKQLFTEAQALTTRALTYAQVRAQLTRIAQVTESQLASYQEQMTL